MKSILKDALLIGVNKNIAEEEYLVASHQKEPASFDVSERTVSISNIIQNTEYSLEIEMTSPGYMEFEAECGDSFLQIKRSVFTSDDFAEGKYMLPVLIVESNLHAGRNFSYVKISTVGKEIKIYFEINIQVKVLFGENNPKALFINLEKLYLEYRLGNIAEKELTEKSLEVLDGIGSLEIDSIFLMLYKAQLYIGCQNFKEAANILEYLVEQIPRLPERNFELICYFNYVRFLYEDFDDERELLLENIKDIYSAHRSWKILWIMLQLDKKYSVNPENMIEDIETEYFDGCHSPIMYVEALRIFTDHPEYIFELNDFEIQVANYGIKNRHIDHVLIDRIAELVLSLPKEELELRNLKIISGILKYGFDHCQTRDIIKALCIVLITMEDKSTGNEKYFSLAISEFMEDIPDLYKYYILTKDKSKYSPIPTRLMEAFMNNTALLEEYQSYFFANVIINKSRTPEYYRAYIQQIVNFAETSIARSAVDEHMSVIYKEILENNLLTSQIQSRLFEILAIKKIVCESSMIKSVIVFHNELNTYQEVQLNNSEAFVKIYSSDAVLLFKDKRDNLYADVRYEKIDLLNSKNYIDLCIKGVPISDYMIMKDAYPLLKAFKEPAEIVNFLVNKIDFSKFRISYITELINNSIDYYYKNYDDPDIHDQLLGFLKYDIEPETRGKLIDILIEKTFYKRAYAEIQLGGYEYVSPDNLMKICLTLIELGNYKYNEMLVKMCEHCFSSSRFNNKIYRYLAENYNDNLDLMLELYRAGNAFGVETGNLAERIIRRSLDDDKESRLIPAVFAKYYNEGTDEELKKKYLVLKSKKYFYKKETKDISFFKYIEDYINSNADFPVIVIIAYLLFMSDKNLESEKRIKTIEGLLKELVGKSIMFNEFKAYGYYFKLPAMLANSVIVSSFNKNSKVAYKIEGRNSEGNDLTAEETLTEIFEGYYTKYFTLFYGERLTYSVDGGPKYAIGYNELDIVEDTSRYSELNRMLKLYEDKNAPDLRAAAKEYFVKDKLIDRLF